MRTDVTKINEKTPHEQLTEGLMMFAGGTSKYFNTGEWRTNMPALCPSMPGFQHTCKKWGASGV